MAMRSWNSTRILLTLCAFLLLTAGQGCGGDDAKTDDAGADAAADAGDTSATDAASDDAPEDVTRGVDARDGADDAQRDGEGDATTSDGHTADVDDTGADGDGESDAPPIELGPYPEPNAWEPNAGPGGPAVTFTEEQLYENCAYLDGGEQDTTDHHNLVTMYDGYLLMPWAPEWGGGGLTFWNVEDPCDPQVVGSGYSPEMRETHSIGFSSQGGRWAVVDHLRTLFEGGIEFWDVSDVTAPEPVSAALVDGFFYPDAYARVVLSVFWQAPYVYAAAADSGILIVDASDPRDPVVVGQHAIEPTLRAGQVQAIGNLLIVFGAETARTALFDISDPTELRPIPGGDFLSLDAEGTPREAYFSNFANGYVYYARKDGGGGLIIYDIHDPSAPTRSGGIHSDGNGGYVFVQNEFAFVGESRFAAIYDISDHSAITEVTRLDLEGDLDTVTPIGNVAVLSVDDEAAPDQGSAVAPWALEPDTRAPAVTWVYPPDGSEELALTSRFGVSFDEFVDVKSAWEGSVRLYETGTDPDETRVAGVVSAQEVIVNFSPLQPLAPDTEYTLEIPAGGIVDFNGNAVEETFTATFRTAAR